MEWTGSEKMAICGRRHFMILRRPFAQMIQPRACAWTPSVVLALFLVFARICAAAAMPSCEGTYAATLLQPLPAQMVVGLDVHDRSPANLRLAERFLSGLHNAGITAGEHANTLLHVSTSLLGRASTSRGGGEEQNYSDLGGLNGGTPSGMPPMPNRRIAAPRSPPTPVTLFLRVDLTEAQSTRTYWIASLQCRVIGRDDGQLAQDIGYLIGGALGQRVERRPF